MTNAHKEIETSIVTTNQYNDIAELSQFTAYDKLCAMTLKTVGANSQRIYQNTFDSWQLWTNQNGVGVYDIIQNIEQFLKDTCSTKSTAQRHLSALRKLTQVMAILDGENARKQHEMLCLIKAPSFDKKAVKRSKGRVLTSAECDALLRVYATDNSLTGRRNLAIIAVMLMTGLRRAELVSLQWSHIDFERAIIEIHNGKGDKDRTVSIMDGHNGLTVNALKQWQALQNPDKTRAFVFCALAKGGKLTEDKPMTTQAVYKLVKRVAKIARVENPDGIAPHDFRRTHITEILSTGGSLPEAQEQAGHSRGDTTLLYARSVNAERRRENSHFRFGAVAITQPLPLDEDLDNE